MKNEDLKRFFHLNTEGAFAMKEIPVRLTADEITDEQPANHTNGIPDQDYMTVGMTAIGDPNEIDSRGVPVSKTFFSRTHLGAYKKLLEWKKKGIKGIINAKLVTINTKRGFGMLYRDRTDGVLKVRKDRDGNIQYGTIMTFVLLKDEPLESELRRRGTRLENDPTYGNLWAPEIPISAEPPDSVI